MDFAFSKHYAILKQSKLLVSSWRDLVEVRCFLTLPGSSSWYFGASTLMIRSQIETSFDLFSCGMYNFLANLVVHWSCWQLSIDVRSDGACSLYTSRLILNSIRNLMNNQWRWCKWTDVEPYFLAFENYTGSPVLYLLQLVNHTLWDFRRETCNDLFLFTPMKLFWWILGHFD